MSESLQALAEDSATPQQGRSEHIEGLEQPLPDEPENNTDGDDNSQKDKTRLDKSPRRGRRKQRNGKSVLEEATSPSRPRRAASALSYVPKTPPPSGRPPADHYWDGFNGLYVPYGHTAKQFLEKTNPRDHYYDTLKGLHVPHKQDLEMGKSKHDKPSRSAGKRKRESSHKKSKESAETRKQDLSSSSSTNSNHSPSNTAVSPPKKSQGSRRTRHDTEASPSKESNGSPSRRRKPASTSPTQRSTESPRTHTMQTRKTTNQSAAPRSTNDSVTDDNEWSSAASHDPVPSVDSHEPPSWDVSEATQESRRQIADLARNDLFSNDVETLTDTFGKLTEFCQQGTLEADVCRRAFFESGVHNLVVRKLESNGNMSILQEKGLEVLFHMSASPWKMADECLLEMGTIGVALRAMHRFPEESKVQVFAAVLFGNLTTSVEGWKRVQEEATKALGNNGEDGDDAVVKDSSRGGVLLLQCVIRALSRHRDDEEVQEAMAFLLDQCARVAGPTLFNLILEGEEQQQSGAVVGGLVLAQRKFGTQNAAIHSRVTSFLEKVREYVDDDDVDDALPNRDEQHENSSR